jgi:2-amino-4-hydroxy-6-hydroxymethyldihydropteridine diphosphokinase
MSLSKRKSDVAVAFLGLGSNLGDRLHALRGALKRLNELPETEVTEVSSLYVTAPVGPVAQPRFLNAVAKIATRLPPDRLLRACLEIEAEFGRVRSVRWGPRTLDLDLLLYGGLHRADGALRLPHPRMTERAFVLAPLAEIAPRLLIGDRTAAAWAAGIGRIGVSRLPLPRPSWWTAPSGRRCLGS